MTGIHPGQSIIENAIVIKNYTSLDTKFTWKADEDGIVKILYYYYSGSIDDLG